MARFQLVFLRDGEEDEIEDHISPEDQPRIAGRPLLDGGTYVIRGQRWLARCEQEDKWARFVLTPVLALVSS